MHWHRTKMGHDLHAPLHSVGRAKFVIEKPCSYGAAHSRCIALWGSSSQYPCVNCGDASDHWAYDGTDPNELCGRQRSSELVYSRYPEFYMPMCWPCHASHDAKWRRDLKAQFDEFQQWKLQRTG
jgi:hypothetical protein